MTWTATHARSAASIVAGGMLVTLVLTPGSARNGPPPRAARAVVDVRPDHLQRGFALPTYSADGYGSSQARRYLEQIAQTGTTWVQFNPTWYQDGTTTVTIAPTAQSPSDESVGQVIMAAHDMGFKVLLKPLLDLGPTASGYRGSIRPNDPGAWFASYTAFITHYAELAARLGVAEFAVGAELAGMSGDRARWLMVVRAVRARFHGRLLYAANFDEYRQVAFWDAVDLIGIDGYWKLSDRPTADVAALRRAWEPIVRDLAAFAARAGRPILFAEAGYTSRRGSTTAPWNWTSSNTPDENEQAAGYQALLSSLHGQSWWAGVFWWCWDVPLASATTDPLGYSPHGKAAEKVVRQWWR